MGTSQQSSFGLGSIFSFGGGSKPALDISVDAPPTKRTQYSDRIECALQDALQWEVIEPEISQKTLDARWRITAERISTAIQDAQKRSPIPGAFRTNFKIVSENLPVLKQALLESRAGIQGSRKLPHVRIPGTRLSVPRSFELATVFLRTADYQFDDQQCARFFSAVQERMALKMAEIWNLRAFLEFSLLEQIGDELSRL